MGNYAIIFLVTKRGHSDRRIAHKGDLNSYFFYDIYIKETFLERCMKFLMMISTDALPEVNSGSEELISIVEDLKRVGFKFI